jgi:hypothetical protein
MVIMGYGFGSNIKTIFNSQSTEFLSAAAVAVAAACLLLLLEILLIGC